MLRLRRLVLRLLGHWTLRLGREWLLTGPLLFLESLLLFQAHSLLLLFTHPLLFLAGGLFVVAGRSPVHLLLLL